MTVLQQTSDSEISLRMSDAVDKDAYAKWTNKLKSCHPRFDDDIEVSTPISQYVPKDRFIPDNMSAFARSVKRIGDCILSFFALISTASDIRSEISESLVCCRTVMFSNTVGIDSGPINVHGI